LAEFESIWERKIGSLFRLDTKRTVLFTFFLRIAPAHTMAKPAYTKDFDRNISNVTQLEDGDVIAIQNEIAAANRLVLYLHEKDHGSRQYQEPTLHISRLDKHSQIRFSVRISTSHVGSGVGHYVCRIDGIIATAAHFERIGDALHQSRYIVHIPNRRDTRIVNRRHRVP
jgi:hypothetical protein